MSDFNDEQPRHRKRAAKSREKRFGYEEWNEKFCKWMRPRWYVTERARDQALEDLERKTAILRKHGIIPQFRKVER